jgi:hypothetical protein
MARWLPAKRRVAASVAFALCATLGACASSPAPPPPPETWLGGDPAHLATDKADCQKESAAVDVRQAAGYSDPRYGVTSAMAAAVSADNPLVDEKAAIRTAAFDACMNDKGWKAQ